jgi:hypothetical protein
MVWYNPFSWFSRQAQNALQNANTNVLKNALRNYIKAVNNYNKNKLTTQDVRNVLNKVVGNNNKRIIKNRLANGVARAIAASRRALPSAVEASVQTAMAGPNGTITESAAAKEVNNATMNVNRAYIMNTILKNASSLATPNKQAAAVQAMINYNPKINFKSLILPPNSNIIKKLLANANTAANAKYGANRKKPNLTPSMPSKQTNAVNIPAGFFNENAKKAANNAATAAGKKAANNAATAAGNKAANNAATAAAISKLPGEVTVNAAKRAANNAIIQNAITKANAITNSTPQANINAAITLLKNAIKLTPNKTMKSQLGGRIAKLTRRALFKEPPVNNSANRAALVKQVGNIIWTYKAWGGFGGLRVNTNYAKLAKQIKNEVAKGGYFNIKKLNTAALKKYLSEQTGRNQAHMNRALAIANALNAIKATN